jgi:hypothetical protein
MSMAMRPTHIVWSPNAFLGCLLLGHPFGPLPHPELTLGWVCSLKFQPHIVGRCFSKREAHGVTWILSLLLCIGIMKGA